MRIRAPLAGYRAFNIRLPVTSALVQTLTANRFTLSQIEG